MTSSVTLPGFDSPAVGFDQPFAMLEACHDRVRRSLLLLTRLMDHIDTKGHDPQSASAASDVLRYFDLAAPLHHQDEEIHVFPVLIAHADADIVAAVDALRHDHAQMSALWAALRPALLRWSQPGADERIDDETRVLASRFCGIYASHLTTEEGTVFPAARTVMDARLLGDMSRQMQARRQT